MLNAVADGLRYALRHPGIGPILLLQAVLALCARPFVELLPGFAAEVFGPRRTGACHAELDHRHRRNRGRRGSRSGRIRAA